LAKRDPRRSEIVTSTAVEDDLQDWRTLTIENGQACSSVDLSINLWSDFDYPTLFQQGDVVLTSERHLRRAGHENFETISECIHHIRIVLEALGHSTDVG
jgi:hypothetical protein